MPQVTRIDQEAFPTLWPPTNFRRELKNHLACYLVSCLWRPEVDLLTQGEGTEPASPQGKGSLFSRTLYSLKRLWGREAHPLPQEPGDLVVGFVGVWFMSDEAHITSIAVQQDYRGRGIGELLLIGALELALARGSRVATLEVRVSNRVAQSLYQKYGFRGVGYRKGYYSDNNEDALLMSTDPLASLAYQQRFRELVAAHRDRWGEAVRLLGK